MRVLLSIKPPHVENILNGTKRFEFRRRLFTRSDVHTVLVYCTRPVGRLVAEFDIAGLLEDEPDRLWDRTAEYSGIGKSYFDDYFSGRTKAFAIAIGELRIYPEPIEPSTMIENFTPPQSYRYVPLADAEQQLSML